MLYKLELYVPRTASVTETCLNQSVHGTLTASVVSAVGRRQLLMMCAYRSQDRVIINIIIDACAVLPVQYSLFIECNAAECSVGMLYTEMLFHIAVFLSNIAWRSWLAHTCVCV